MNELDDILFKLNGGWAALFWQLLFKAIGYIALGALVHLGWKFIH